MLYRIISLFLFLTILSFHELATACEAPPGTNFTRTPRYWCTLDARVSITTTCDTEVEEIITVPWTTGMVNRVVPTDENQKIEDLSASRLLEGRRISIYSMVGRRRPPGNVILSMRVVATRVPVTIVIKYKKTGGVQIFSHCSGIGHFTEVNSTLENSLMMSKWAVGGRSAAEVLRVRVIFVLSRHQRLQYVDTLTTFPAASKQETENLSNDIDEPVRVIYDSFTAGVLPSKLFFYVRFMMHFGIQSCPLSRTCEDEDSVIKEGRLLGSNHKIILGLTLGLGFAVIIVSIVTWVCCCKWIRENGVDPDVDGNIPVSLRHFTYDTADEEQRGDRERWTEVPPKSNELKKEFYALDLSPSSREKKGSDGF